MVPGDRATRACVACSGNAKAGAGGRSNLCVGGRGPRQASLKSLSFLVVYLAPSCSAKGSPCEIVCRNPGLRLQRKEGWVLGSRDAAAGQEAGHAAGERRSSSCKGQRPFSELTCKARAGAAVADRVLMQCRKSDRKSVVQTWQQTVHRNILEVKVWVGFSSSTQ